jgi:putative SOS response-associated peptidase YedK
MCGRYALRTSVPDLARRLGVDESALPADAQATRARYNIAPTQAVLVLRRDGTTRRLEAMRWGLVPSWSRGPDSRYAMHNARIEGVAGKPAYRGPVRRRRCLVPADGWYEWQRIAGRKQPWLIHRADDAPFCFAGLWDEWQGESGALRSCSILTAPATGPLAELHPRMPVIAPPGAWDAWLDPAGIEADAVLAALDPAHPPRLISTPVGSHVNNARNDDPRCVEQVTAD